MTQRAQQDRLLNGIIVYGFSLSFGFLLASSQALRATPTGFAIVFSWRSLVALALGAVITLPCFLLIVHAKRALWRRVALGFVVFLGLGAFFYPMRVVPLENHRPVFIGLAVAVVALSVLGCLLLMLRRFFEREDANQTEGRNQSG